MPVAHHEGEEMLESGYIRILTDACATGRRLTRDERESLRAGGERAAEAGTGLRELVRGQLAAAESLRTGLPRQAADHLLSIVAEAVDVFAEGHERAQRLAVRRQEAARREFIDDLLYGRSDLGRLAERAERFGLLLSHAHAVAVAEGPEPYDDGYPVTRQVEASLLTRFGDRHLLLTTKDGRLICIAPGDQQDVLRYFAKQAYAATDGGRVAVGRAHPGPGGVVHSYEEALNALDLASRMDLDAPVLHAADLLVYPVLTRDRQAMADLVLSVLGPLRTARGGARPLLDTLTAYFDTGCVAAEAARRLSLSVRAMTYRLDRIHKLTAADPSDPVHRYTLQTAVIGARLLGWPEREL
ncbi:MULTISPECIES: PucR family transcriptional regulator [Streptomyces]|uniref:Regulator n=1 Tax=Streptomyces tsukubensis (strain DSM 42081 / NBRC 108919 / NRRL 18488 / 9993) TaxID=1114943 RepID=I2N2K1_STRT9|nr:MULTISPECIES: helix-turn-helix domain-containing protein [Streptomyces]AZK95365.1 regulator [Streptomyces tsukubensis]EIF91248.1 regulator [Streptomyces tsukubensis NRRL18488]MYS64694.1 PucR family transcriptional regulator [Streptomyces sp. SID5473]QKM68585.1 regulator [Streptomyces tsukubensis NRRL18488]TAI43393.1 PucR family transcriptional regulator [Streptomyces tsukubensis]